MSYNTFHCNIKQPSTVRICVLQLFHLFDNDHEPGQCPSALEGKSASDKVNGCRFTHTLTNTHAAVSSEGFGLVAAARRVTWHLASRGSGAMVWHPTLQGHVPGSKGKRSAFLWVTPELGDRVNPQHLNTHMHSAYYCATKRECM